MFLIVNCVSISKDITTLTTDLERAHQELHFDIQHAILFSKKSEEKLICNI